MIDMLYSTRFDLKLYGMTHPRNQAGIFASGPEVGIN
jgi:hypothetical protein